MEILEVTAAEYSAVIPKPYFVFGTADFALLNSDKADTVYYLLFKDKKYRLGLIGGLRNNQFHTPFSAPFGGFVFLSEDIRLTYLDAALDAFIDWARTKNITSINITLPPPIYNESFISKQLNTLYRKSFSLANVDLNYSYNLSNFDENYQNSIWYNAKKNLSIALENDLSFSICTEEEEKFQAYTIIKKNRDARGFPLRMTRDQVCRTTKLIPADFFIVKSQDHEPIAAAIAFHVSDDHIQIIYWGDLPEFVQLKTMNFLSYKIFEHYKDNGMKLIDIGPSSENSRPNYGLCEFKESIGCDITTKFSLKLEM